MTKLARELTTYGLTMVAIGSCIGSGIFVTPAQIASLVPSSWFILAVWLVGGIITLTGALTFSEMGSMFPHAGGIYVYLRDAYGEWMAFLYGWAYLLIITSGSIAVLSLAFTYYLSFLFPMDATARTVTSILVIFMVTTLNVLRAKFGEMFSNLFTGLKIAGITIIILLGLIFGNSHLSFGSNASGGLVTLSGFGVALTGVLFSYSGWQHASYLAGEARNPEKSVPVAMTVGSMLVIVVYILINISYLFLLPVKSIAVSQKVAAEATGTIYPWSGMLVAVIISVCTLGTIGIYTLTSPRIYYAMAGDGLFFRSLARVHPKFHTPIVAIITQSVWSVVLLLFWGTFEDLITYTVSIEWIFFALAAASIYVFRLKMKDRHRPYKTPLYPVTPAIFVGIVAWFLVNLWIRKPLHVEIGAAFLALGLPFYLYFKRKKKSGTGTEISL
ncbi:MAG TPA: amino acid permease [Bacteroidales bacterium]|nr:amino acid permease [Bacteroidales bacterium]